MLVQFHLIAMTDRRRRVVYRSEPDFVAVDWVHFLLVPPSQPWHRRGLQRREAADGASGGSGLGARASDRL